MGIEDFTQMGMDESGAAETMAYVDTLRDRISKIRTKDTAIKKFAKEEKKKVMFGIADQYNFSQIINLSFVELIKYLYSLFSSILIFL